MARARRLTPEFEHDLARDPALGYEAPGPDEFVRCIEHGSPTPLERWHCHDEYELQLIVGTRGRAFIGDYDGHFEPGHLVLTGPRLPHNWISTDLPPDGLPVRSLVLQFREEPLREGMRAIRLNVTGAFHSPRMAAAQPEWDAALAAVAFAAPGANVISCLTGEPVTDPRAALAAGLTNPVRFRESLLNLGAAGVTHFVEVGPGKVLSGLAARTLPEATVEVAEVSARA